MMRFAAPQALFLLALLPLLMWYYQRQRQHPAAIAYSSVQDLAALPPSFMTRLRQALPGLRVLVFILCILALARPQHGLQASRVYSEGIAILMVVDTSSSMKTPDMVLEGQQANRLQAVKQTFQAFVQGGEPGLGGRQADLIGMVTFARYADSVCPLTLDHDTLLALLEQVHIVAIEEEDGTAIGQAIALGVTRLKESTAPSRVMILLTDGTNNAGETAPLQAAEIAKALGIKIYTIGAGRRGTIDAYTLTQIATLTGGQYFHATDAEGLHTIYSEINQLEKTTLVAEQYQEYAEHFAWFLLPALGCLVVEIVLINTRFRTIP